MIEIKGKVNTAICYATVVEAEAIEQIRRMCEYFGYRVEELQRVRIMNITLDGIEYGKYRFISESEVDEMLRLTEKNNL